ncbi:MAG: Na+/H+ antiporter subunit E [Eubacteriales bacterium]|nr:Na+/H+ antiporter subunit E [Eubacteriales bacterium]
MIILLFLFWLALNGKVTLEIVLFGLVISVAVTFAIHRLLDINIRKEVLFFKRLPGIVCYLFYLVGQIVLSNLQVMRLILKPDSRRPKIVWFSPKTKGETAKVALANSITLTPGTVTVALGEEEICVYALRSEMAEGLEDSGFVEKLCRLEGEKND